jgi:hypothetical protein
VLFDPSTDFSKIACLTGVAGGIGEAAPVEVALALAMGLAAASVASGLGAFDAIAAEANKSESIGGDMFAGVAVDAA